MSRTLRVSLNCLIITDEADVAARVNRGETVWSWCSRDSSNWLEPQVVRTDVVCYLAPDFVDALPPDPDMAWPKGQLTVAERKIHISQLAAAYGRVWGVADGMSDPTLADLCQDKDQLWHVQDLMDDGLTWAQVAEAVGIPAGKEPANAS